MADPTVSGTAVTRLAEIRARLEAVPRGPWVVERLGENGYPQRITNAGAILIASVFEEPTQPLTIAPFLAAARTDVEVLLDIVEATPDLSWLRDLKVSIHDEHAADGITPAAILAHLAASGWSRTRAHRDPSVGEVWEHPSGVGVLVPFRPDYADYGRRVMDVIYELADVEKRGPLGVLMDLREASLPGTTAVETATKETTDRD